MLIVDIFATIEREGGRCPYPRRHCFAECPRTEYDESTIVYDSARGDRLSVVDAAAQIKVRSAGLISFAIHAKVM